MFRCCCLILSLFLSFIGGSRWHNLNVSVFFVCMNCFLGLMVLLRWAANILDECDIVALQHDPAERATILRFQMILFGIVQHQIHVFVETNDVTLDTQWNIFVQPNLNTRTILQVSKNQIDGLHHHFLHLRITFERHFCILWLDSIQMQ